MNIDHELAGKISGLVVTIGFIPYVVAILRKDHPVLPSKASWSIWAIMGIIIVLSSKTTGSRATLWLTASYAICPVVILGVVLWKTRHRQEEWGKVDRVCFWTGLLLIAPWLAFKIIERFDMLPAWAWILPRITLCGGIIIDAIGALPTIRKSWKKPDEEDVWTWTFFVVGNFINLLAVETWSWKTWDIAIYPIYVVTPSGLILPPLLMHAYKKRMQPKNE